ncbi:PAS domain S-box protein [Chloroflexota bacterium]
MIGLAEIRRQIVKRISSETRETDGWLEALADNSNIGVYVVQDGKFRFVNSMFQRYVGYNEEELVGMDSLSIVYPEDRDMVRKNAVKMLKGESTSPYEFRYVNKGGECLWVMESVNSVQYQGRQATLGSFVDTTQRKQIEDRYRQLLDDTYEGYGVTQEGKIVFANRRFCEIFGYKPGQVLGKPLDHFLMPDDRRVLLDLYKRVMRSEESVPEPHEMVVVRSDGTPITIESNIKIIHYNGKPSAYVVVRDITDRRHAEEELIAAQKYAHNLIDRSLDMIISVDRERRIVEFNLAAQKAFGYSKEEVLGDHVSILYADPEEGSKAHEKAIGEGQFTGEVKNKRKNGETFISYLAASALLNEKDEFLGIMGVSRDITERKQAEDILRESEEKLRLIFESVPEGIVVSDLNGKILDINKNAVHMHDYDSKEELIGRNSYELVAERERASSIESAMNSLNTGHTGLIQCAFVKKDGKEFTAVASQAVLRDASGQPRGMIAVTADITEQQKMQEQLMLADRLASIGQLAAGIAHEINNPLTGVVGISELLMGRSIPDDIKEDLEIIDKEARRAAEVVKGLLTFARSKGNSKSHEDINSIIQEVLRVRSYEQRVRNIEVDEQFCTDLPHLFVNGAQMQQVFMNLIVNAEQSMLEAHKKGKLKVNTEEAGDMVRICINDDGPGISPENMQRLFTPFFTTKEVGKGTGLGLSICHGIVTEHGGRIYAESEPGLGASFILELPIPSNGDG